jgi:hypothetical protein
MDGCTRHDQLDLVQAVTAQAAAFPLASCVDPYLHHEVQSLDSPLSLRRQQYTWPIPPSTLSPRARTAVPTSLAAMNPLEEGLGQGGRSWIGFRVLPDPWAARHVLWNGRPATC